MKRIITGIAAIAALAATAFAPGAVSAQDETQITLLHGIPGSPVDVSVDGDIVVANFTPGSVADLSAFAGDTLANVNVLAAGTDTVVIGPIAALEVPASGNWTIVAHLDAAGTAILTPFENDVSPVPAGQGRLTVRHTAFAPPIDLIVGDDRPIENAANGASATLLLPVGPITGAMVAPTGEDGVIEVPTIDIAADTNVIVYVVGSLDDSTIEFLNQRIILVVAAATTTTTTVAGATTTTDPNATTTTSTTTTTIAGATTTTTTVVPTGVPTGSPLGDSWNVTLIAIAFGAVVLTGGLVAMRRRVEA